MSNRFPVRLELFCSEEDTWLEIKLYSTGDMSGGGIPSAMEDGSLMEPLNFREIELSKLSGMGPDAKHMISTSQSNSLE